MPGPPGRRGMDEEEPDMQDKPLIAVGIDDPTNEVVSA